jgi:creatinine amidohydrolase/Fe(II)-dependent formamide hydrolase-like protein
MRRQVYPFAAILTLTLAVAPIQTRAQQTDAPAAAPKRADSVRGPHPVKVLDMPRPIDIHDSVWISELTALEVRDLIKGGKTTALILGGGMEENGPYLILGKHNTESLAMGEAIARKLGNTLCAPVITLEPGNPEHPSTPGGVVLTAATYASVLTDMATSLKAMGFKSIVFLGDHGGDLKPMSEVSSTLNEKWKGAGAMAYFVENYGNNVPHAGCCGHPEAEFLGINEQNREGLHDSYVAASMIMTIDVNAARIPERISAGKTKINGVDLLPVEKTLDNGKKLIDFRSEATVKEIRRLMATTSASIQ